MGKVVSLREATNTQSSTQQYDIFTFESKAINIDIGALKDLINELGFYIREGQLIRETGNIIEVIEDAQVIHKFIHEHIDKLETHEFTYRDLPWVVHKRQFMDKWLKFAMKLNFNKNAIIFTLPQHIKPVMKDTADTIHFAFNNGVVVVTKKDIKMVPYSDLKVSVWRSHLIDFDIDIKDKSTPEYKKFIWNLSGKDRETEQRIHYALGYLMHDYVIRSRSKIILLYDKTRKKGKQGGTGKDLLFEGLSYVRRLKVLDGKKWKLNGSNDFFYQGITIDTQIVIISDPEYQSQFNDLFVKSQGPLIVDKKHKDELYIERDSIPKFGITSNLIFDVSDSSNKRRQIPIVVDGYYRDMKVAEPIVKEHKKQFYVDWSDKEWNSFYMYLCKIAKEYLSMPAPQVNFDGLIKQRFQNKHGLLGKFIIDLTTPKLPKLINAKEAIDHFIDSYVDLPEGEAGKGERHSIAIKFNEILIEWLEANNVSYESKRVNSNDKKTKYRIYALNV